MEQFVISNGVAASQNRLSRGYPDTHPQKNEHQVPHMKAEEDFGSGGRINIPSRLHTRHQFGTPEPGEQLELEHGHQNTNAQLDPSPKEHEEENHGLLPRACLPLLQLCRSNGLLSSARRRRRWRIAANGLKFDAALMLRRRGASSPPHQLSMMVLLYKMLPNCARRPCDEWEYDHGAIQYVDPQSIE
ncbi:uncharacterized protein PG986_012248 [Apiospora aurea]|uniref:Uncharacterized protein n=1 Tax=Apiospora aurea TaxID=335848 RepID=A0ABR1PZF4_9PEZI